jgi:hypothetical protein
MIRCCLLCLLLLSASRVLAQGVLTDPPVVGRPADFSNLVGKYEIKVSAEPTDVPVEQAILLRVEIIGTGPAKYEPNRKGLKLFPDSWEKDFYVQELRDEATRDNNRWTFVYRLKPKHTKIDAIDGIKLVYYDPTIPGNKKFVTKYPERIPLKIHPKPDLSREIELDVRTAPDSFYQYIDAKNVLDRSARLFTISGFQLAMLIALPPLICLLGALAWRRCFPSEAQRARLYRMGSAQRALAQRQAANTSVWQTMCDYLRERFDFSIVDPTPAEVALFLKRRGFARPLCDQVRTFFAACDAIRFTPSGPAEAQHLRQEVTRLILALEADPCAHG